MRIRILRSISNRDLRFEHDHGISGYSDQGRLIIPDIHLNADDAGAAHRLPLNSIERKDAAIVPHQAVAHQVRAQRAVGVAMLNLLIGRGSAVNVASLFYLTPPTTALIAWALFGETLSGMALVGMVVAVAGVWLARQGK